MGIGRYEGVRIIDDVYTRMHDAMMESIPWNERLTMATNPFRHCQVMLDAALACLEERCPEAIEAMDMPSRRGRQ
jgi:hypothetical protein